MWRCGRVLCRARYYSQQAKTVPPPSTVQLVDGRIVLTPEQTLGVQQMLRNGNQVAQIAQALGTKQKYVKTLLRRREEFGGHELHDNPWTEQEEKRLMRLMGNRRAENVGEIAKKMGRYKWSITRKIRALLESKIPERKHDSSDWNAEISEEQQAVLHERLMRILSGLMRSDKTEQWRCFLENKSESEWALSILPHIPRQVQHVLAAKEPPTAEDLRELPWKDTRDYGVYVCILEQKRPNPKRPYQFIYIGSGSRYNSGLAGRKTADLQTFRPSAIEERSFEYGLERSTTHHATLFSMPVPRADQDGILHAKYLTALSKIVMSIWLHGLSYRGPGHLAQWRSRFLTLSGWDTRDVTYRGTCFRNPLLKDITLISDDEEGPDFPEIRLENKGLSVDDSKGIARPVRAGTEEQDDGSE